MGSAVELASSQSQDSSGSSSSVWSTMLKTVVHSNERRKMGAGKRVVVLGENDSGKTTLVAKLAGVESPKKGCGLEYSYVEIRDEYRDDSTHLSIYVLDGNPAHSNLLQFALNESNYSDTLLLLTVSMEKPWALIEQLQFWMSQLHDHVDGLKLGADAVKELRGRAVERWLEYTEPGEEIDNVITRSTKGEEEEIISLPGSVLVRNLGLDLVVVVTKTDSISTLERDSDLNEEHFDYIQHHLRQFCLQYGASLFYTSVKDDKNCDLLYKYLVHRIYNLPFRTPALIVERDAVFIPSGWDNEKKIGILQENIQSFRVGDYYGDVIKRPMVQTRKSTSSQSRGDVELEVEDEQLFLERQLNLLMSSSHHQVSRNSSPQVPKSNTSSPRPSITTPGVTPKKGDPTTGSQERVLANFFNSLLSKRSPNASLQKNDDSSPSSNNTSTRSEVAAELDSMLNKSINQSDC